MDTKETKEEIHVRLKMLEALTGSVISSYVALHYLEGLKRYGVLKQNEKIKKRRKWFILRKKFWNIWEGVRLLSS